MQVGHTLSEQVNFHQQSTSNDLSTFPEMYPSFLFLLFYNSIRIKSIEDLLISLC